MFETSDLPPVLTMADVARYLRIGTSTAYELAHRPDFPAIRIGRTVRVRRDDFIAWCESQARGVSHAQQGDGLVPVPRVRQHRAQVLLQARDADDEFVQGSGQHLLVAPETDHAAHVRAGQAPRLQVRRHTAL